MVPSISLDRVLRPLTVLAVLGLGAVALIHPAGLVIGGAAWIICLVAVLSGWGALVARIVGVDPPDLALRATWGAAAYLAIAGPLVAVGQCSRLAILTLVAIGAAGFTWRELTTPNPSWRAAQRGLRLARTQPAVATLVGLAAVLVAFHALGGAARLDRNPWDDDLAYTPLLKRLLDVGNLIEPFSFRRLGSYGGQTVLQGLAGVRNLASVNLLDRGLAPLLVILLLVGHARAARTSGLWLGVAILVVLFMPDLSVTNTASHWTGVAMFLGLYRTISLVDAHPPHRERVVAAAALVAAATCTLRQNYVPVALLFLGGTLLSSLRNRPWRTERRTWLIAGLVGAATLVPYAVAAFRSSGTFLYPFLPGTWNPTIPLRPTGLTALGELQFLVVCFVETHGIVVIAPIIVALGFARDLRPSRPLTMMLAASAVGFVLLVHSLAAGDSDNLWRYAFGYTTPLVLLFALEAGVDRDAAIELPTIGRWVLLAALLVQLNASRAGLPRRYKTFTDDLREAAAHDRHGDASARGEARRYAAMQATLPPGARAAVMVDDPAYLDFARNDLINLDTPGFASWAPGLPAFQGPEAWRRYFLDHEIRYLAFVRTERSRYFFRRPFWIQRLFTDAEFFQIMSAYTIDAIDTLTALAEHGARYDEDGLVVIDLGATR
jgi:hypothetical protein